MDIFYSLYDLVNIFYLEHFVVCVTSKVAKIWKRERNRAGEKRKSSHYARCCGCSCGRCYGVDLVEPIVL